MTPKKAFERSTEQRYHAYSRLDCLFTFFSSTQFSAQKIICLSVDSSRSATPTISLGH
jgi:hypothetical protein